MDRLIAANSVAVGSGDTAPVSGTPGEATDGNPGTGVPATIWPAYVFNAIQAELVALLLAAGITLDRNTLTQIRQAIRRFAAANIVTKTANATLGLDEQGLVLVSAAAGNVTLTLPAVNAISGVPLRYMIVRTDTTANTVTIARGSTDTIQGATSLTLPTARPVTLVGDASSMWRFPDGQPNLGQRQVFTSSGSFTAPFAGWYFVRAIGGGGAGGGSTGTRNGGGGGSGEYAEGWHYLTAGQVVTVTIGAGGTGNVSADGNGGGTTSFGALMTAIGGFAGVSSAGPLFSGGKGGLGGTGGQMRVTGGDGQSGSNVAGGTTPGGNGGAGFFGGGGLSATVAANAAGAAYGSGGGGTFGSSIAGGAGAAGMLSVEW